MYESLIAFFLGKKTELTEEDLKEFMELLVRALDVESEYERLEKQAVIEKIVDSVSIKDQHERKVISNAIESILEFEEEESSEEDIFEDRSEVKVPLKMRKVKRGEFTRRGENENKMGQRESETRRSGTRESETRRSGTRESETRRSGTRDTERADAGVRVGAGVSATERAGATETATERAGAAETATDRMNETQDTTVSPPTLTASEIFSKFTFDLGDLEENHVSGPDFPFELEQ